MEKDYGERRELGLNVTKTIEIGAPLDEVYATYADIKKWKDVLSDCLDVQVIYDDGHHQEFLMEVDRSTGPETVRSIRFCDPAKRIEIFQTQTPPGVKRMSGVWTFQRNDQNGHALVQASRNFELKAENATPEHIETFKQKISYYLMQNLTSFKKYIEQNHCAIQVAQFIPAQKDVVFELFWHIQEWQKVWDPVDEVSVLYDDGRHQEFAMQVWRNDVKESVRTIRFALDTDEIIFFSPDPPLGLIHHTGSWSFTEGKGGTNVIASRQFRLSKKNEEEASDYQFRMDQYADALTQRLGKILESFAVHFHQRSSGEA